MATNASGIVPVVGTDDNPAGHLLRSGWARRRRRPRRPASSPTRCALCWLIAIAATAVALTGCGPLDNPNVVDAAPPLPCDPQADQDGDCIPDGIEGCLQAQAPDSDSDGMPDFADRDADGDGIPDHIEAGANCQTPRDSDGDTVPDYRDTDSDDDGLLDSQEDRDNNGIIGSCTATCTPTSPCDSAASERCSIPPETSFGVCISPACLDGESDPRNPDTDGDGELDDRDSGYICNEPSSRNPVGLLPVEHVDSASTSYPFASWRLALDPSTLRAAPIIAGPGPLESAYVIDSPGDRVAGFLATRAGGQGSAAQPHGAIEAIADLPLVDGVIVRSSGTHIRSIDGFGSVVETILQVRTIELMAARTLRDAMVPTLLGRVPSEVTMPDTGWSDTPSNGFIVTLYATDRESYQQTVLMGAVARRSRFDDRSLGTATVALGLAGGTHLTLSGNLQAAGCEQRLVTAAPAADVIWVIDESSSTAAQRTDLADLASYFFARAALVSLDLRVGVTDMGKLGPGNQPGLFASRATGSSGDRWLGSPNTAEFSANLFDPSGPDRASTDTGYGLSQAIAAIERHTPRDSSDPQTIRPHAALTLIWLSDEKPREVEEAGILADGNVAPTESESTELAAFLAPTLARLEADGAAAHLIGEPLPFEAQTCVGSAEHAFGYYQLAAATGGQVTSICQSDFRPALELILESTAARASAIQLEHVPIASTISVLRDGVLLSRSRETGWDYHPAHNAIVLYNLPVTPGTPADIVVSYRRWATQAE